MAHLKPIEHKSPCDDTARIGGLVPLSPQPLYTFFALKVLLM